MPPVHLRIALIAALVLWGCSERQPTVAPQGPLYQYSVGQSIQTTTSVVVHSGPGNFASSVGSKPQGALGTIQTSPGTLDATGDNTIYWQVAFSGGPTGWVSGVFLAPAPSSSSAGEWYVSPTGSQTNPGTQSSPWSLQWAFSGSNSTLKAGDVVWLLPGTYGPDIDFEAAKSGAAGSPITYRQHPSGRATIDGRLRVHGAYTTFWGFEVTQSNPTAHAGSDPWYGIESYARGAKFINLVIHDVSKSGIIVYWPSGGDNEVYGCVIYNNGVHNNLDHGIYLQNNSGTARVEENVVFNNTSGGIHSYTESNTLSGEQIVRNVAFNNGSTANPAWGYDQKANLIVGGTVGGATGIQVDSNYLFEQNDPNYEDADNVALGFQSETNSSITARDNIIWGGKPALHIRTWTTATVSNNAIRGGPSSNRLVDLAFQPLGGHTWSGNQYYAALTEPAWSYNGSWRDLAGWLTATGLLNVGTATGGVPGSATTVLRPNKYDASRALLVVFNWSGNSSVSVNLSGFIGSGQSYTIRNVQNIYGTPVASGLYSGSSVSVPMTGTTPAPLVNHGWTATGPTTGPYFHTFIVTTP